MGEEGRGWQAGVNGGLRSKPLSRAQAGARADSPSVGLQPFPTNLSRSVTWQLAGATLPWCLGAQLSAGLTTGGPGVSNQAPLYWTLLMGQAHTLTLLTNPPHN